MDKTIGSRTASRKIYIEFLRIVACFSVIVNHTNSLIFQADLKCATGIISLIYFYISKISVTVFLFIMGAVLLGRQDTPKKSIMRIVRTLETIVLFAIPYYLYHHYLGVRGLSITEFIRVVSTKHITVAHWYMYAYVGLLFILPLMQKMSLFFSKRDIQLLVGLSLGINGVAHLLSVFWNIQISEHISPSLFNKNIALVFAGYYLEKYCKVGLKGFWRAFAGYVALVAIQVLATLELYDRNPDYYLQLDNYAAILIVASAACVFCMAKYFFQEKGVSARAGWWIEKIGGLTFGIYLVSDMVIDLTKPFFAWLSSIINPIPAVIAWELLVFAIGMSITLVLKRLPVLRKLL